MMEITKHRMKLSQLRSLVAVAEHGNFSEAAVHLELSQSAVSHAIASLEEELGVGILPRLAAEPIPLEVQLCSLPTTFKRTIGAAILAKALQTPAVFAFRDTIKEVG
ncbi:Transcriptional regulator, LysR family [uncultured Coleofasciculus sp.]|uniref:Transcriptional regulator, LysR family n=1 Tax=uncultured Coleofasciculus sp. TaxID=1267456 RepID=A0A6J4H4Q9_9CYAN|nr:Transcriptional regulator, LysR family [uncultured Coleofasciculus sp.]